MRKSPSYPGHGDKAFKFGISVLASTLLAWLAPLSAQAASTDTSKPTGIACTTSAGVNPTFTLDAKAGYIQLADGTTAYMWSYANGGGAPFSIRAQCCASMLVIRSR